VIKRLQPGEASLVADVLQEAHLRQVAPQEEKVIPTAFLPLVRRLFLVGAAELRAARRAGLVSYLIRATHAHDRGALGTALLYFLHNERPAACWTWEDKHGLWPAIEAALQVEVRPSLAIEAVASAGDAVRARGVAVILAPLSTPAAFPSSRRALIQGIAEGRIPESLEHQAVMLALGGPAPDAISFDSIRTLDMALDQISSDAAAARGAIPDAAGWLALLLPEHFRLQGLGAFPNRGSSWRRLARLAGSPATSAILGPLLRQFLNGVLGERAALAREIMDDGQGSMSSTSAAVTLLASAQEDDVGVSTDVATLEAIRRQLEFVVSLPWREPAFGVDLRALFGTARRVEFTKLDRDDKVRVQGEVLHVLSEVFEGMASRSRDQESTLALASIYLVHELVHVAQGIGDKDDVTRLRATGGETTLMHVDLAADHAAAVAVARVNPRWELLWLKDLQGRSLDDFPARWTHTVASRARKAARLVGLRVDYLARRQGIALSTGLAASYLFADFGPAGGTLLVMASGPPTTLVGSAPLSREDAEVLAWAADEPNANPAGLGRVDDVLLRALAGLGRAGPPGA
jgi:hypothetical protein